MAEEVVVTAGMIEAMAGMLGRVAGAHFDYEDKDDRRWLKHNVPKIYRAGRELEPPRKSEQRRPVIMGIELSVPVSASTLRTLSEEEFREVWRVWEVWGTEYMRRRRARTRGRDDGRGRGHNGVDSRFVMFGDRVHFGGDVHPPCWGGRKGIWLGLRRELRLPRRRLLTRER